MSVREQLIKSLSVILRQSKATLQVLLTDENGLSIAKASRSADIDSLAISSVSAATYNFSEEIWRDLGILHQRLALAFFEKFCLITIRIAPTILTIAHDFNTAWPVNAEEIGKIIYQLKHDIDETFNPSGDTGENIEVFSTAIRNILYLFNMGNEIPFLNYVGSVGSSEIHDQIATILDGVQNPVFARYGIVSHDGLMLDGRDLMESAGNSITSFSASTIVSFQRLVEESSTLGAGPLLAYICISGSDEQNLYATIACPAGNMVFKDDTKQRKIVSDLAFVSLFPLSYGMIPVLCEIRNIVYSMVQVLGEDETTTTFLNRVNNLITFKFE